MSKKIRFVLVLVLLVLASTSAFASSFKTLYYSNSSFTTVVGGRYDPAWDCPEDDLWWRWGVTSSFKKTFDYSECYEGGSVTVTCFVNGSVVTCP